MRDQFGRELVQCGLCKHALTAMTATKRCDACYELESRIQRDPELARKILAAWDEEHRSPESVAAVLRAPVKDCGEAGHAEGTCGNASCLSSCLPAKKMYWAPEEEFKVEVVYTGNPSRLFDTTPLGIKVTHIPTGQWVVVDKERSQHRNRDTAFRALEYVVAEFKKQQAFARDIIADMNGEIEG